MPLQTTGEIKLSQIATEFTDAAPHQMSEFYSAATGIPASGEISIADFYGASAGASDADKSKFKLHTRNNLNRFKNEAADPGGQKSDPVPPANTTAFTTLYDTDDYGSSGTGTDALIRFKTNGPDFKLGAYDPYTNGYDTSTNTAYLKSPLGVQSLDSSHPNYTNGSSSNVPVGFGYMAFTINANSWSELQDIFDLVYWWSSDSQNTLNNSWAEYVPSFSPGNFLKNPFNGNRGAIWTGGATIKRSEFTDGIKYRNAQNTFSNLYFRYVTDTTTLAAETWPVFGDTRETNNIGTWMQFGIVVDGGSSNVQTSLVSDLDGESATYTSKLNIGNQGTTNAFSASTITSDARLSGRSVVAYAQIHCYLTTTPGGSIGFGATNSSVVKVWDDLFYNTASTPALVPNEFQLL
jgi:hypothetical protein